MTEATPLQIAIRKAIANGGRTRDYFDSQIQKRLGTTGKLLYDIDRGKSKTPTPAKLAIAEEVLGLEPNSLVRLAHPSLGLPKNAGSSPRSDHPPTKSVDGGETAPVLRLDLSYSMGPGRDLDDSYVEAEAFEFDLGFLRSLTITPAERLRIVDGIGDSMQPTIHDRDLLFIDTNQATLNSQDRVWAIWLFGLGAVKRLRAIDDTKVLVMSDNPDVENQVVNRSDIIISGRVVGSIKRH